MDFLEMWKTFPVLWRNSPTSTGTAYAAAVTELTARINTKRNLTINNIGMILTLGRIRKWFENYKSKEKISDNGRNIYDQEYYKKCSEFLSKRETRTVPCDKCRLLFADEIHLQKHKVAAHKQFCDICQKTFRNSLAYRNHAVKHAPPKHQCQICARKYIHLAHFKDHMRAHRNERNFVCDKCGKGFVRQKNLRGHILQKHTDKATRHKVTCAICDIDFNDWSVLSLHRRKHHMVLEGTIEQLQCKPPRKLTKHAWTLDPVTMERRVRCDVCDNTYVRYISLYRHKAKVHGIERPRPADAQKTSQLELSKRNISKTDEDSQLSSTKMGIEDIAKLTDHDFEEDAEENDFDYVLEDSA